MVMFDMSDGNTQLGANGRVVIPAEIRTRLGLEKGDELVARLEGTRVTLERPADLLKRIQAEWKAADGGGVTELLAERRREFEREEEELTRWLRSRSSTRRR